MTFYKLCGERLGSNVDEECSQVCYIE